MQRPGKLVASAISEEMMDQFGNIEAIKLIGISACIGYIFGALVMIVPLILQGLRNLRRSKALSMPTSIVLELLFSLLALSSIFLLPATLGKYLQGRLSTVEWLVAIATCALTVFVVAKILVQLGVLSDKEGGNVPGPKER